jgi:hypothetical protein
LQPRTQSSGGGCCITAAAVRRAWPFVNTGLEAQESYQIHVFGPETDNQEIASATSPWEHNQIAEAINWTLNMHKARKLVEDDVLEMQQMWSIETKSEMSENNHEDLQKWLEERRVLDFRGRTIRLNRRKTTNSCLRNQ